MIRVGNRFFLWGVIALVAVATGVSLARLTWRLTGETGVEISPVTIQHEAEAPVSTRQIVALAPFGEAAVTVPSSGGPVEETSLGLVLHGVLAARDAARSQALIASGDGDVEIYRINDSLPGGATLTEIFSEHVVIEVGGRRETLSFPEASAQANASGVAAIRARLPASVTGGREAPASSTAAPEEIIDDYRQRIARNPQTVLDELGVAATPDGYRIGDTPAPEVRRAGLQPGDVVVRVNGHAVGNIENDRALYDEIAASGQARVEVVRGERRIVLSFPLR